jgi:hypothetical protein
MSSKNVLDYNKDDINELKEKFTEKNNDLFDAKKDYELVKSSINNDNLSAARDEVENFNNSLEQDISMINQEESKIRNEIQTIQNENNSSKEEYNIAKENTNDELNYNLASFPLKSQTDLKKKIIYLYLFLQLLGVFLAIFILYIQTQSKPSDKIKPKKIRKKATNQLKNIYGTGLNYTDKYGRLVGSNFLDYANRGTAYGIKQGKQASRGLSRFLFGDQIKR